MEPCRTVALEDCGYYARWLFDNAERANGMNLEVAIEQVGYQQLAAAFQKVTGRPAKYIDTELEAYWSSGPLSMAAEAPAGYNADPTDKSTMSVGITSPASGTSGSTRSSSGTTRFWMKFIPTASRASKNGSGGKISAGESLAKGAFGKGSNPRTCTQRLHCSN